MTPRTLSVLALGGDGIGPELVEEGLRLLEHVCTDNEIAVSIQRDLLHGECYEIHGTFCRDETVDSAKKADAVLVGAVGAPQYDGLFPGAEPTVRDGLMRLRKELDLFAGIRPVLLSTPDTWEKAPQMRSPRPICPARGQTTPRRAKNAAGTAAIAPPRMLQPRDRPDLSSAAADGRAGPETGQDGRWWIQQGATGPIQADRR